MKKTEAWLYERAKQKSAYELDLCNVLDVKGGILLAIIAIIASDPLRAFSSAPDEVWAKTAIIIFGTTLLAAAIFSISELWPKEYRSDPLPSQDCQWVENLREHFKSNPIDNERLEDSVWKEIVRVSLENLQGRASENSKLNESKIRHLSRSFRLTAFSIGLYMVMAVCFRWWH
ncbi:MAG: hypothetical protein ACYDD2_07765 [Candidatus Acidiferrales bacterium]